MEGPEYQDDQAVRPATVVVRYAIWVASMIAMIAFIPPFANWLAGVLRLIGL